MLALWLVLIVCALLWRRSKRRRSNLEPPEYPGALPLVGHISLLLGDSSTLLDNIRKTSQHCSKIGGAMVLHFGFHTNYFITNPDDAVIVGNNCLDKNFMYSFAKPWTGNGLLTGPASIWKKHRKLLNPTFNQQLIYRYLDTFNSQSRRLLDQLASHVGQGPFDHREAIKQNALEAICSHPEMEAENKQKLTNDSFKNNEDKKTKSFLELLMELSEEQGLLDYEEVREHVDTMIVSGYDTISCVLLFTLVLIGSHQEVQERLLKEIKSIFADTDRDVIKHDLSLLIYMDAVIKESLRLYSPAPIIARHVSTDVKLKNSTLLAGNACLFSIYGINRHPMWGDDANEFRPERWLNQSTLPDNANAFLAFGVGRRNCIGKTYAMTSLKTTLVHFLRRYKVTADHSKLVVKVEFMLQPVSGHEIAIEERLI